MTDADVRDARPADAACIARIWNRLILDTAITFTPAPKTDAEVAAMIAARQADGHGFFVAEGRQGDVLGFATYAQFRAGAGYARCMEHSVHLAPQARGVGIGSALMARVHAHARAQGARLMIGAITGDNEGSIAFHTRLGYLHHGRIPAAGWKFGRFHDLVLMGLDLDRP